MLSSSSRSVRVQRERGKEEGSRREKPKAAPSEKKRGSELSSPSFFFQRRASISFLFSPLSRSTSSPFKVIFSLSARALDVALPLKRKLKASEEARERKVTLFFLRFETKKKREDRRRLAAAVVRRAKKRQRRFSLFKMPRLAL